MSGARSRRKGAEGERAVAALAVECGFPGARRGAPMQAAGGEALPDVDGVPGLWIECKRHRVVPVGRLAAELLAAERPGLTAVLLSRDDGRGWIATLDGRAFLTIWRSLVDLRREVLGARAALERAGRGERAGAEPARPSDGGPP